jgi:hypothetical protein
VVLVSGLLVGDAFDEAGRSPIEFRPLLQPYGHWRKHARWGEVWSPARVARHWRPYTLGRWIYSQDWGWYWVSSEEFGWLVYHYGRWILDPKLGWIWTPGDQWAPAWVQWRFGFRRVGWAPLAPDAPPCDQSHHLWVFVHARDFTAARIEIAILPRTRAADSLGETAVMSSTTAVGNRPARPATNPGIPPALIAAAAGRPVWVHAVDPRVVAGTFPIAGAHGVREEESGGDGEDARPTIRQTGTVIRAAAESTS